MTMNSYEWRAWRLDQKINRAGLPVDLDLVRAAIRIDTENRERLINRAAELMGVDNPNSRDQFIEWLRGEDVEVDTLRKADVAELRKDANLEPHVREALEIRSELSRSSIKKYYSLLNATGDDGRLRGCFQFNGASRTGRFAGRLVQPQNLPRGKIKPEKIGEARAVVATGDLDFAAVMYPSVSDLLESVVRPAIAAPKGKKLVVSDFSSIETVMIAWAAECPALLDVFRTGRDAYKDMAVRLFGVAYEDVTKAQRTYTKPIVLGCGYMLGANGMIAYAKNYGVEMSEKDAAEAVAAYREGYPEVVTFWARLNSAAIAAVHSPGIVTIAGRFRFKVEGDFLFLKLPSGRKLGYHRPTVELRTVKWTSPEGEEKTFEKESLTYMGQDQFTKKWTRIATHPGKITENIIQAVARDLLIEGLLNADAEPGLEIVGHVHDEIICLADEDDATALPRLISAMTRMPSWASDAPVNAAGWEGPFYMKD